MPTIFFADLDALRLALASGAVPSALGGAPARAGFDAQGHLWLQPEVAVPREAVAALARFGAAVQGTSGAALTELVPCWQQLLALQHAPPNGHPPRVLFAVPDGSRVPTLIAELQRLGAPNVGVCWLSKVDQPEAQARDITTPDALLLVEHPPLYTLLLAGDGDPHAPHAFVEQAPAVWVEHGRRHPLAEQIRPPKGTIALLTAPRGWSFVPDGPFTTGPDALPLPRRPADAHDRTQTERLPLEMRLVADSRGAEAAEFWVLRDRAGAQLRNLVRQSDDALLARLSLAAGRVGTSRVVVLRVRTDKRGGPPVLVLDALACRSYLRLPNLFVPCGLRLRPALRRDALRNLLAADPQRVTWLEPTEGGGFTVQSIPATAFRPFAPYVKYTRERDTQPLSPDLPPPPFILPPYTVRELRTAGRRPPTPREERTPKPGPRTVPVQTDDAPHPASWLQRLAHWFRRHGHADVPAAPRTGPPSTTHHPRRDESPTPSHTRDDRRAELEARFLQESGGGDRAALWPELATVYAALNRPGDAAVCWLNALWEQERPRPDWARGWLRAEARLPRGRGDETDPGYWLDGPPTPAAARAVAASVVYAAADLQAAGSRQQAAGMENAPSSLPTALCPLPADLGRVQRLLEDYESALPVRAAWLAHLALARLSGGDVVGLARTRDRLLERLYQNGLSLDLDVPAFLRFAGQGSGDWAARAQEVRDWLSHARESVHRWVAARPDRPVGRARLAPELTTQDPQLQAFGFGTATRFTRAYADLILAWGLTRLGDRSGSQELLSYAQATLANTDEVHAVLFDAYAYRARQALEGRPAAGPLPADLLARLEALRGRQQSDPRGREEMPFYKAEKLRAASRILNPAEKFDVYRATVIDAHLDDLQRSLTAARALTDRDQLARRFAELLAETGRTPEQQARLLEAALAVAPRVGEAFAEDVLGRLVRLADRFRFTGRQEEVNAEVAAVERGLFVAAHFDRGETIPRLLACLDRLLAARRVAGPNPDGPDDPLVTLVGQGLRGLRRLGLRDDADRLLQRLSERLMPTPDLNSLRRRSPNWAATLRRLLALTGGWFYVARDDQAESVLEEARRVLLGNEVQDSTEQTNLAVAYMDALGQAPVSLALPRVEEVFHQLHGVRDTQLTKTHYSLAQLRLIEAAVLAVVNDDFTLAPTARRWLDDDEYVVRRRIHADVRAAVSE
jgi:FtsH ternary system domain X7